MAGMMARVVGGALVALVATARGQMRLQPRRRGRVVGGRALKLLIAVLATMLLAVGTALGVEGSRFQQAVRSANGVVAAPSALSAEAGASVLAHRGNAIDAAVTAVFAAGVTQPHQCGIGGGGFLLYRSAVGETAVLDFQRRAPAAMTPMTLYTTPDGIDQFQAGHLVAGVPGVVAGMAEALDRYGTIELADAIAPAEQLARDGFAVGESFAEETSFQGEFFREFFPETAATYLKDGTDAYQPGDVLVQKDHAKTLHQIAAQGPGAFYRGTIARRIVEDMESSGAIPGDDGIMTLADLADYRPIWRGPISTTYRGHTVISAPPPAEGVGVLQTLNLLEGFDVAGMGQSSADELHLMAEAQKLSQADTDEVLGDPAYINVPTATLIDKAYAAARRAQIDISTAKLYAPGVFATPLPTTVSSTGPPVARTSSQTAHISAVDSDGNAVSVTCSLGFPFGSAVTVPKAGFLLNEMPFGPVGDPVNGADGGKRPATTMSPTIVLDADDIPVLITGAAGSAEIPRAVVATVVNMIDFDLDIAHAVDAERISCTNLGSGRCQVEGARLAAGVLDDLAARGHPITNRGEYALLGIVQAAGIEPATGDALGTADPRRDGAAAGG
jgi:gamma-glutamyltranspeptidase / glutathione hydrolase